jgi:hypothetical protein
MAKLQGIKEIATHLRVSEPTAYMRIKQCGCPAEMMGGTWVSDSDLIDAWWKEYCTPKAAPKPENMLEKRNGKKKVAGRRF